MMKYLLKLMLTMSGVCAFILVVAGTLREGLGTGIYWALLAAVIYGVPVALGVLSYHAFIRRTFRKTRTPVRMTLHSLFLLILCGIYMGLWAALDYWVFSDGAMPSSTPWPWRSRLHEYGIYGWMGVAVSVLLPVAYRRLVPATPGGDS